MSNYYFIRSNDIKLENKMEKICFFDYKLHNYDAIRKSNYKY